MMADNTMANPTTVDNPFSALAAVLAVGVPGSEPTPLTPILLTTQPLPAPESVQPLDEIVGCDTCTGGSRGRFARSLLRQSQSGRSPPGG